MGQTLGWIVWDEETQKGIPDKGVPDWFNGKFKGRWEWFREFFGGQILEVDVDSYTGDSFVRPADMEDFNRRLGTLKGDIDELENWAESTKYLEEHPNTYVNYG